MTRAICGFCSTGCSLDLHLVDNEAIGLTPSPNYPVNSGTACPKGWEALTPLGAPDRGTTPLLRGPSGAFEPITWNDALDQFVTRAKAVQSDHGPGSLAFLSTGQIPTEEMALLGALAKFGMGIEHGDGNTRQCMATSVVAYKQSFGFDAPPYTYADLEESDVVVLIGSNLAIAHPIMWERVLRNPHNPEIVVIDPRHTETASAATLHLPLKPASDLELLYGVAKLLIDSDAIDGSFIEQHTEHFDGFVDAVASFDLTRVSEASGLDPSAISQLATTIANGKRVSFWWTMGVNQSHQAVRTAQAIINLSLLTGNIGRPGTGANSVTGQCNAMGSRLFSNTTNLLGGHDFANAEHRTKVAKIAGVDEATIPHQPSWAYDQIMRGIDSGDIRGLWVVATNTAHSWIDQNDCHGLLDKLDFLVVQDLYPTTETAQKADLYLPAAGWGEKDGTFINSERRIGHITKARMAPGQALADFWIFKAIADAWGCGETFAKWESPEAVFNLLQQLSVDQPCDITGIEGYRMLEKAGGVQWPFPTGSVLDPEQRERRLFEDGKFYTESERARFIFDKPAPPAEDLTDQHPLVLLTGRGNVAEWHTRTRTGKSAVLASLTSLHPYVELHPNDAEPLGIRTGQQVVVCSLRGSIEAKAVVTSNVGIGRVFMPMHYDGVNALTYPAFDPHSRQPAYKHAAVSVKAL